MLEKGIGSDSLYFMRRIFLSYNHKYLNEKGFRAILPLQQSNEASSSPPRTMLLLVDARRCDYDFDG